MKNPEKEVEKIDLRMIVKKGFVRSDKSLAAIAREANVSPITISNFMKGVSDMNSSNLQKLLTVFKVNVYLPKPMEKE